MSENKQNNKNGKDEEVKQEKLISLPESEIKNLKVESEKAKEYWDKILRLQADFENTRKRLERERQDYIKFANEGIIAELLNILDDLKRAVELAESGHQDLSAFLKGVEMIMAHLYDMLKEHGIKPIDAEGKPFDPNFHEALMQVEDNNKPEHTVVEELQKGYLLNDRIIRTAKVKVSVKQAKKD